MNELFRRLTLNPALSIEIGVASLFANVLALATPLFVIQVLNRYVAQGVDATLLTLTVGAVLAILFEFLFRQIRISLARGVSEKSNAEISLAGYGVLLKSKAVVLDRIPIGQRQQIMASTQKAETAYSAANIATLFDVPFSLLFVGVLYLLSPVLAGIVCLFMATVYFLGWIGARHQQRLSHQIMKETSASNMLVSTAAGHIDTVRGFNASGFLFGAWNAVLAKTAELNRSGESSRNLNTTLSQSAAALMSIVIVATGAVLVVAGTLDVGTMIGANILAARALSPVVRLSQLGVVFANASESLKQLKEFGSIPQESPTGSAKPNYTGRIELKDVAFAWPASTTPLFESLSVDLTPGSITAVCGANGTGKTTLARVLTGILDPGRGQILVDGLDLQQASLEWWRSQIAYLPQEPTLLNTSLRENILMGNPDAGAEALAQVIQAAGLRTYLDESPDGLETLVSNNGASLSLGIRRRVALARALVGGCKVAIFDEPTDGLDREGIASVYAVMSDLAARGSTIIAISHDPRLIKGARQVIDLNIKPAPRITARPQSLDKLKAHMEASSQTQTTTSTPKRDAS